MPRMFGTPSPRPYRQGVLRSCRWEQVRSFIYNPASLLQGGVRITEWVGYGFRDA